MVNSKFMGICLVTGFLSTLLTGIALISASDNSGVLKNLSWAHGYYHTGGYKSNLYVSIYEYGIFDSGNDDFHHTYLYADNSCYGSFCDKCSTNMQAVLAFLVIFFLASLPALLSDYLRYNDSANTPLMRWIGIGFNAVCVFSGCIGMITFVAGCQDGIKSCFEDYNYSWNYGPSFGMFAASSVFKFLELICCFIFTTSSTSASASASSSAAPSTGSLKNPLVNAQ